MRFSIGGFFLLMILLFLGACQPSPSGPSAPAAHTHTPTPLFSPTPTSSPTATATCVDTATSTATPSTGNSLSGSVTYTGSLGSVDSTHPLVLALFNSNIPSADGLAAAAGITVNGSSYQLNVASPGTYYAVLFYDWRGAASATPIGSPYYFFNNGCTVPIGNGIAVSGATSGPAFSFGDGCRYEGLYGTAHYSGSRGEVSVCHPLLLAAYSDASYSTLASAALVTANGSDYDLPDLGAFAGIPQSAVYVRIFYDGGGNGILSQGDPYRNLGALPFNTWTKHDITLDDSFIQ